MSKFACERRFKTITPFLLSKLIIANWKPKLLNKKEKNETWTKPENNL